MPELTVTILDGSLFEVKDQLPKKGERYRRIEGNELELGHRRADFVRETRISAEGVELLQGGLRFRARIAPKEGTFCDTGEL